MLSNSKIGSILDTVSEKDKLKEPYLRGNIDRNIVDMFTYYKHDTVKAYEIYNGYRGKEEFASLTANYGVGTPHKVPNMRLMGKRINALIGKHLQNELDYNVTSSDETSILSKLEEKKHKMLDEVQKEILSNFKESKSSGPLSDKFIKSIQSKYGDTYKSDLEIIAQDYLECYKQSKDLQHNIKESAKDFVISGYMINRIFVKEYDTHPEYWRVDPREFFYERNPNSMFIEDAKRCVYRRFMSATQILNELGSYMTKEERQQVAEKLSEHTYNENDRETLEYQRDDGVNTVEGRYRENYDHNLIEVFHTEWIATNEIKDKNNETEYRSDRLDVVESSSGVINSKARYREDRYEGWRISLSSGMMYVGMGKSNTVVRSNNSPTKAKLSYNGLVLNEQDYKPFSMVMATKELSDLYDITHFHLNNLYASIRPGGTYTVAELLPTVFGNTPEERMLKSAGYEKTLGTKLISISQEGMEDVMGALNTLTNYPTNMDGQVLQAYISYIQLLENQADQMLGLNNRMLGEMEERDGKGTTMMAIQQGEIITKELYFMIDLFIQKSFTNITNLLKVAFKNPKTLSYATGSNFKAVSIMPNEMNFGDFNIFVTSDADEIKAQSMAVEFVMNAVSSQSMSLSEGFKTIMSKSLSRKIQNLEKADQNMLQQLNQQLQQLTEQAEELEKVNKQLTSQIDTSSKENMEIKKKELELKFQELIHKKEMDNENIEIKKTEIKNKKEHDEAMIQAEVLELYDGNKRNDEINQNR